MEGGDLKRELEVSPALTWMVVTQRVCTLQEMCSMTSFLDTEGLVRALDTLEVMAVDKVRDTETPRIFIQTPYCLHVMCM